MFKSDKSLFVAVIVGGTLIVAGLFAFCASMLGGLDPEQQAIEQKVEQTIKWKSMKDKVEKKTPAATPTAD